jgi:hypothetical protein
MYGVVMAASSGVVLRALVMLLRTRKGQIRVDLRGVVEAMEGMKGGAEAIGVVEVVGEEELFHLQYLLLRISLHFQLQQNLPRHLPQQRLRSSHPPPRRRPRSNHQPPRRVLEIGRRKWQHQWMRRKSQFNNYLAKFISCIVELETRLRTGHSGQFHKSVDHLTLSI